MNPEASDLVEPLARVVRGYYDDLATVAARHGLSTTQARALVALDRPLSMSALAEHLVCDASNATGLVARMEARGLVRRHPSPEDRRSKVVTPTEEGRALARTIRAGMHAVHGALGDLTPTERAVLLPLLDLLGERLADRHRRGGPAAERPDAGGAGGGGG
ncbi:MarR family winged helix-turn-helix transcriptional regulator, partial [Kitasatospora sp. NPDC059571]|uniref:MarR family winged helix-turn-helix transcriptional regulator n=1 Tax=Kitasatospora sp. NPDC059571 TaxID=3346871 RepID=UPI0036A31322